MPDSDYLRDFFVSHAAADLEWAEWVAAELETAGIMKRLDGGPALLFTNVKGHDVPVVGNFLAALATRFEPLNYSTHFGKGREKPGT